MALVTKWVNGNSKRKRTTNRYKPKYKSNKKSHGVHKYDDDTLRKEFVKNGEQEKFNFEEEDLEEDDYYYEDDK